MSIDLIFFLLAAAYAKPYVHYESGLPFVYYSPFGIRGLVSGVSGASSISYAQSASASDGLGHAKASSGLATSGSHSSWLGRIGGSVADSKAQSFVVGGGLGGIHRSIATSESNSLGLFGGPSGIGSSRAVSRAVSVGIGHGIAGASSSAASSLAHGLGGTGASTASAAGASSVSASAAGASSASAVSASSHAGGVGLSNVWKRSAIDDYGFLLQPCDPVASDCFKTGSLFAFSPYGYGIAASGAEAQSGSYYGGHGGGSSSQAIASSQSQSSHGISSSGASAASQAQSIGYPLGRSRRALSNEQSAQMRIKRPNPGTYILSRQPQPVSKLEPSGEQIVREIASLHPSSTITTHGAMSGPHRALSDDHSAQMRTKRPNPGTGHLSHQPESVKQVSESEPLYEVVVEEIPRPHPASIIKTHGAMSGSPLALSGEQPAQMRINRPNPGTDDLSHQPESVKPVFEIEPSDEEVVEDIGIQQPAPIITTHSAMSGSCASGLCTPPLITSSVISQPSPLVGPVVRSSSENEEVSDAHAIPEDELYETDVLDPVYIRTPSEHSTRDLRCETCADALSTSSSSASSGIAEDTPVWEKTEVVPEIIVRLGGYGGFGGSQSSSGSFSQASSSSGSASQSSFGGISGNTGFGGGSSGSSSFSNAGASSTGNSGSVVSGSGTCSTGLGGCVGTGAGYSSGSGGFGVTQSSIGSKPYQGFSTGSPIKPGFLVSQGYGSGSQEYGGSSQGYGGVSQGYGGSSGYGGYGGYQPSSIQSLGNQGGSGFIVSSNRPSSGGGSFGSISSFGTGGNMASGTGSQFVSGSGSGSFSGANSAAQAGGSSIPQVFPSSGSFAPGVGTSNFSGSGSSAGSGSGSFSGAGVNSGASGFGGSTSSSFSGAQSGAGAGAFGSLSGTISPVIPGISSFGSAFNTASSSSSSSSSSSNSNTSSSGFFGGNIGR